MERKALGAMTLDEVADWKAMVSRDSTSDQVADAEFLRRQTKAAEDTARFTRVSAICMAASVMVIAVTSTLSALFAYLAWAYPHVPH
jgi:hypothetical protein